MPDLWLPVTKRHFPEPKNEREELMNKLYDLRVIVADASIMPIDQLRGIVAWQEESARKQQALTEARKKRRSQADLVVARRDLREALKDIKGFRDAKRESRKRLY